MSQVTLLSYPISSLKLIQTIINLKTYYIVNFVIVVIQKCFR